MFHFRALAEDQRRSIQKGIEILMAPEEREKWREKAERMVGEKGALTGFLMERVLSFRF